MSEFPIETENLARAKATLRTRLLAARRARSDADLATSAAALHQLIRELLTSRRPATVAGYVPVGREPGGSALPEVLAAALPAGGRLLLPVLRTDLDLDWAVYAGPRSLSAGARGLREPTGPRLGHAAVQEADLVIVPALAVDGRGVRLGRGGGSYDRVLARVGAAFTVALLHDGELIGQVPAEPHDRPVRAALTPGDGLTSFDRR